MSGSVMIVLIVVVWLFVLAPLVFGGNSKPIRRAGEAYDETRVLHEGGTEPVQARRRPKLTRADVRYDDDDTMDLEVVDVDNEAVDKVDETRAGSTILIDDTDTVRKPSFLKGSTRLSHGDDKDTDIDLIEGEVVEDLANPVNTTGDGADEPVEETAENDFSPMSEDDADDDGDNRPYDTHESYLAPEDLGYVSAGSTVISIVDDAHDATDATNSTDDEDSETVETASSHSEAPDARDAEEADDDELTAEELAFAESRRGRGGWDPVADKTNSVTRYQRRQRTFLGLCAALVVGIIIALVAGGWAWALPVVAVALIAWYLVALRALVRQEQQLRARRVRQLRRARLGVRSADKEAPVPPELRRPGAIIVEMDDDSPDFDYLPVTYASEPDGDHPTPVASTTERRVS